MKKSKYIDDNLLNRIIKVAYGEGSTWDVFIISYYSKKYPAIKNTLNEFKETSAVIASIRKEECPDKVIRGALRQVAAERSESESGSRFFEIFIRKPVLSSTAIFLLLAISVLFIIHQNRTENSYSDKKIVMAERQIKESLAIVGRVFDKTQNIIEKKVLEEKVTPPVKEGLDIVNNLLKGGS